MPLAFLLDEHLRGELWNAIVRRNAAGGAPLDVVRVGDPQDLPLGSSDPQILLWAERESRIVLSKDYHTMPAHLQSHLDNGHHSPGVVLVPRQFNVRAVLETLELIAFVATADEFADAVSYIP